MVTKTTSCYILDVWKENLTIWRCMNKEIYYRYYFRKTLFVVVKDAKLAEAHVSSLYTKQQRESITAWIWLCDSTSKPVLSCPVWRWLLTSCHLVCPLSIWIAVYLYCDDHFIFTVLYKYIWVQKCTKCVIFMTLLIDVFSPL